MESSSKSPTAKESWALFASFLVIVGACYLFGYWGSFGINVLEWVSVTDLPKLAIYPLLASVSFAVLGYLLSEVWSFPGLPEGGGSKTAVARFGVKHWRGVSVFVVIVMVVIVLVGHRPYNWFVVSVLISGFSIPLFNLPAVKSFFPNRKIGRSILSIALSLPVLSFAYGGLHAFFLKSGRADLTVDVVRSKLALTSDEKAPVAFVGVLGGYYFLLEIKTGQLVILKPKDESPLILSRRKDG